MAKTKNALLHFKDNACELSLDGCGSHCDHNCPAMATGFCRGCTGCGFKDTCAEGGCEKCWVRCYKRNDIQPWIDSLGGLQIDNVKCSKPFTGDLPLYLPQVRDNIWFTEYPAYVMNADRIVHYNSAQARWLYQKNGIRKHCRIPEQSKLILSFCLKDAFLEDIWARNQMWQDGESFWAGLAKYDIDGSFSIEYSCYANQPRMEHAIAIKRNALSASSLAGSGIPVLFDLMYHTDRDLELLLHWSNENQIEWHILNFQYTKKVPWVLDLIIKTIDKICSFHPRNRVVLLGIGDTERTAKLGKRYGNRISVCNAQVYIQTAYHRLFHRETRKWLFDERPLEELFKLNLKKYVDDIEDQMR